MQRTKPHPLFLRRVRLRNYKSIKACDLSLRPLTLVIGRNGAGKSNFLDALHFVADSLRGSLPHAIVSRGGGSVIRRRSMGHPRSFAIELEIAVAENHSARYGFEILASVKGVFTVNVEQLQVFDASEKCVAFFRRRAEHPLVASIATMPPVVEDRLYLANAAGLPVFRPVYDALLSMGFYSFNPEVIKEVQQPDTSDLLHYDGRNVASIVARLSSETPEIMGRIQEYLSAIIPVVTQVEHVELGPRETLLFSQTVDRGKSPWQFYASSMSDGTLRALAILVAANQIGHGSRKINLVAIEEPEEALHPAAVGVLVDALREASSQTQILVTSHSPDLLDQIDLDQDGLLVVVAPEGTTRIAPADAASMEALRRHLYSPGELLRMDQLQPDPTSLERQGQIELFGDDLEVA